MKKGQITILGSMVTGAVAVGIFVAGILGNSVNRANDKAQMAIDKTAELSSKVDVIANDVQWIRNLLERQQKSQSTK